MSGFAQISLILMSILVVVGFIANSYQLRQIHSLVNSRLTEALDAITLLRNHILTTDSKQLSAEDEVTVRRASGVTSPGTGGMGEK